MAKAEKTTAARLLTLAVATVGIERLSDALQVAVAQLEPFVNGARAMTLIQQRALGLAALTLSVDQTELRRQASALLVQVRAAEDYRAGVTERHTQGPPTTHWW